jgi:hypothetical protein
MLELFPFASKQKSPCSKKKKKTQYGFDQFQFSGDKNPRKTKKFAP